MKLNRIEFMLMNNRLRGLIQEKYEAKLFRSMSSITHIETALEIGCGNGNGTRVIKKLFSPNYILAIDLDEKMIKIAQQRNRDISVTYKTMDASKLDFPDNHFDAIFDFAIIHHIPNWKDCIQELKRVLKPNGEIILEELSTESFSIGLGKFYKKILDHPYQQMFSSKQFTEYMTEIGFTIEHYKESRPLGLIRHFTLNAIKK
jgi:ubiquinone/menaquinone biosynthesis C-methylase UbiE